MAVREQDERLVKLREDGNELYSYSKLDTINNCLYAAYLTYIKHEKGSSNIYSLLGTRCHDTLEEIINGTKTEVDLLPALQQELDDVEMFGFEFPKDRNGGDSIKQGWVADMKHFCNTFTKPNGKFKTEELFIYKTDDNHYLQGYIDLIKYNQDGTIDIYDWKTSSMYSKDELVTHGRQLITYALAKKQEGYNVKRIAWIMVKFAEVEFMGKKTVKSKEKTKLNKVIERKKIAEEMAKYVEQDLFEAGYDEIDTEIFLSQMKEKNDFSCLPEDIAKNYKIKQYVMYYDLTDELLDECITYFNNTISLWESLDRLDENSYPPRSFIKLQKNGKEVEDTFFCNNLCNHKKTCKYIYDYNIMKENNKNKDEYEDLF